MDAWNCTKRQFWIIIEATDAPNTTNVSQMRRITYCSSLVSIGGVGGYAKDHDVAVRHSYSHLSEIIQGAHAVHTFWHFDSF